MPCIKSTTEEEKKPASDPTCSLPKVCLGRFLNIVIPATKVVQMLEPSHRPHEVMWMKAATLTGTNSVERAASATAAVSRPRRTCALVNGNQSMQAIESHTISHDCGRPQIVMTPAQWRVAWLHGCRTRTQFLLKAEGSSMAPVTSSERAAGEAPLPAI